MFVVAALFTVMAAAAVMEVLGLSTALGAFIAGVMLADSPYRHELEADVEPFRSILLGLFFLAVGMMLDLHAIAERPLFVIGMALALVGVKALVILLIGLAVGMRWRAALALGLLLSQGRVRLCAVCPGPARAADRAAGRQPVRRHRHRFDGHHAFPDEGHPQDARGTREGRGRARRAEDADRATAIVVGYGRFGQTVAQMLNASDISVTMIDTDIEMIDIAAGFGAKVYFGDGTRLDLLRLAGAEDAAMILFCMDGDQLSADAVEAVHQAFPQASLYVRAYDRRAVIRLKKSPAARIVREVLESAVKMARLALADSGVSGEAISRAEEMYRASDRERLTIQIEAGDVRAARDRIITSPAGSA
jgi:CPA2 family monovalent cation:H+ antiporter-2/glutathione-regulated potassium-efflux system protein KefB